MSVYAYIYSGYMVYVVGIMCDILRINCAHRFVISRTLFPLSTEDPFTDDYYYIQVVYSCFIYIIVYIYLVSI